ncbi:MAG: cell division protein FtsQ/DivIB [Xanthobacteraceae bacterium]
MDGGGRLDQPLKRSRQSTARQIGAPHDEPSHSHAPDQRRGEDDFEIVSRYRRLTARWAAKIAQLPRGTGVAGSILLIAGTLAYGAVAGEHVPAVMDWARNARDVAANTAGFRIAAISLSGEKEVSREEILTTAGVTERASLLFLDADAARKKLLENPWIADAAVLKLYPDRLQITITERHAFALWQKDGGVSVIAADGTVLEPFVEKRFYGLPLVVGRDAERQAKEFLDLLDRYPEIRSALRASILVADRRWDLRLINGINVQLPETDPEDALHRLVQLDHDKKLLSRDITVVDLRLPDRVTVRLSDAAAQARDAALKAAMKKKKAGDA